MEALNITFEHRPVECEGEIIGLDPKPLFKFELSLVLICEASATWHGPLPGHVLAIKAMT